MHENAELVLAKDGRVVVYMGDDARNQCLYRFVSEGRYQKDGDNTSLLDKGRLYAAKFHDDGRGRWLELLPDPQKEFMRTKAEVCVFTRWAAKMHGATGMDRPEWVAAHPDKAEVYCALTNNAGRTLENVNGPNPRAHNIYGHIVRWRPDHGDHTASGFDWDLFVKAGNPFVHKRGSQAGSPNINRDNMFNSPDGLAFDAQGRLWIQTDGQYANEGDFAGYGHNQMMVGDPESKIIKRFMVGPRACEVTGLCWSPDRRTMFVGIQHPFASHFPDGGDSVPRSSVIAITREDGGLMG